MRWLVRLWNFLTRKQTRADQDFDEEFSAMAADMRHNPLDVSGLMDDASSRYR